MGQKWAENLFRKVFPDYRHHWEIYDELLRENITKDTVWLDIGCGANGDVAEFGKTAKIATGIDIADNRNRADAPFLKADLRSIPLPSSSADLVTLRMVTEHLERIPDDFLEIDRLLVPGGTLLLLTTNCWSPIILFPRLLPFRVKRWVIAKLFNVPDDDVLPTYHRFNSAGKMTRGVFNLKLSSLRYLEQVPFDSSFLTCIFGIWYCATTPGPFRCLRSNLLAVFHKIPGSGLRANV